MARIALCTGTTTGPCVAVLDGDGTYTAPAGHFIAPDNSGDVGDTWGGSSWTRLADPGADSVQTAEWRADGDTGELRAVQSGVTRGLFDASGRFIVGHTVSVAAVAAALAQIHRESDDPALSIIGYGSTAASFPSVLLGRSKGTLGAHGTVDGSHVLGRVSVVGATAGDLWQESSRLEWTRDSGGTVEGGDALASTLRLWMQVAGTPGLAELMRWTHTRRVGINVDPAATLHVNALDEADVAFRVSSQSDPVLNVLGDGTVLLGALARPDLGDGTPPLHNVAASGLDARALVARFSADALGPSLVLAKSRAATAVWTTATLAGDEVGSIDWRGADGSGPIELARIVGLSAEADAAAGALAFELLKSGDSALSEVARITEGGAFGVGVDEPEARFHARETVASETGVGVAAVFEALVDVVDPEASDDPDVGHGVRVSLQASKSGGGSVLAAFLQTRAVDVTADAEVHDLRIFTLNAGASSQCAEFGAGQIRAESGAAAAPSLSFKADPDTGFYRSAGNKVGVATGGTLCAEFGSDQVLVPNGTDGAPSLSFINDPDTGLYRFAADQIGVVTGGVDRVRFADTFVRPTTDNAIALGGGSNRWSSVFATTGIVNTSDAREKFDLGAFPLGLEFVEALQPRWFRWLDGSRRHAGLYAQEVAAALVAAGIDPATAGMWTRDNPADPDSRQGLRMDQFIAPLIRAVQQLAARVAALEAT